jgi:hypothetical protein
MAVTDYSATPASNVAISGINIAEGCPAANINNGFRQVMADVRVMYDNLPSVAGYVTASAGTFSGTQPIYTGRGAYLHHNGSSFSSGRIFTQASGGSVPAGMLAGDLLFEY